MIIHTLKSEPSDALKVPIGLMKFLKNLPQLLAMRKGNMYKVSIKKLKKECIISSQNTLTYHIAKLFSKPRAQRFFISGSTFI